MPNRQAQRGSAMLITMILISAILAGAAVLVSLQLNSNKASEITNTGTRALHCAEAGLAAARSIVAANPTGWSASLSTSTSPTEPSWLTTAFSHDLDGDGTNDVMVSLEDDQDEYPTNGGADNPSADVNNKVYLVSRCGTLVGGVFTPKYADFPRTVREMISITNQVNCYNGQKGGCGGNNNMN